MTNETVIFVNGCTVSVCSIVIHTADVRKSIVQNVNLTAETVPI